MVFLVSCFVSKEPMRKNIRLLQKGIIKDDASYIYNLPIAVNSCKFVVQGYYSRYTHSNRVALDFKLKKGTEVFAARSGVVIRVKKNGHKGGLNKKYKPEGNYIVIQHADSSRAGYWHLQQGGALVNIGDTVAQGQLIGLSGGTGYSLFPHLHFLVWRLNKAGEWQSTGTRFKTSKGIVYLRPFRKYCNCNP